jgi:aldehyde:ferredoxin oxidoreductase
MTKLIFQLIKSTTTPFHAAGVMPDMDMLLKGYYAYRKWDWETGRPTKEKLRETGLH